MVPSQDSTSQADESSLRVSGITAVAIALGLIHFPLVILRLGFIIDTNAPWPEFLILAGPASAMLGAVVSIFRRARGLHLAANLLLLIAYVLIYATWWLAAGQPALILGLPRWP